MTLQPDYFDSMYELSPDPWGFESRWYEARKYAISLAVLPAERYGDAFEPGCSIGVLDAVARRALRQAAVVRRKPGSGYRNRRANCRAAGTSGSSSASCPERGRKATST